MDVDDTVSLLQRLGDDEVSPPIVDLNLAIQTGRKRLRRRRTAGAVGGVAAIVTLVVAAPVALHLAQGKAPAGVVPVGSAKPSAVTTSAPAGPTSLSCVETRLATPKANQEGLVFAADPSGRFMVGRVYSGGRPTQVAIWDNGKLTAFTMPGDDADLIDVNSSGVAIGESFPSGITPVGWIYANGKLSRLPGSTDTSPVAINDQGMIVGTQTKDGLDGYPIVWHSATSNPVQLPLPAGAKDGGAADVDSDGTIVGSMAEPSTGTPLPGGPLARGVVWRPDGTVEVLPLPTDLVEGVNGLEIHSIRHGVITAAATITSKTSKRLIPVTYDLSTGRFTVLPGANIWINRGNAHGDIAGDADNKPAVYTPATGVVLLPVLTQKDTSQALGAPEANAISDNGLIVGGQDVGDDNVIHAVAWTCH